MSVRKRGNKTSFSLSVVGIKVTRPIWKLDDHGVYETYYRTIRFELYGGKVLDVYCSGAIEEYIKLTFPLCCFNHISCWLLRNTP